MTPVGVALMLTAVVLVLVPPRKWVIVPFLLFTFLTPLGQQFYVGGLHVFADRIVILCGCLRFLPKSLHTRSAFAGGFTSIDKAFLLWALCRVTAFVLLYQSSVAVVNQFGFLWDALGGYFLLRCLIWNVDDIRRIAKVFVVIAVILAGCMLYEHYKLTNVFAFLMGGKIVPDIRAGKIRCRGPFAQQIIASVFGGSLIPFFLWLWTASKARIAVVLGLISSVIITLTASSSTGIAAAAVGVGTLCLWPLRKHVRRMLWGLLAVIVGLALVMKAPVWFVLARIDFVGGSTGWDRANLISQCVRHFGSWWLVGTSDNGAWGYYTWDLCDQFVAEAVQGGLATLILFLVLIARSFREVGVAQHTGRSRTHKWLPWTMGCILCAHIAGFVGISYFDQVRYWWYVTLAMIPAATTVALPSRAKHHKAVLASEPLSPSYVARSTDADAVGW
jgi:hypothetical protein